MFFTPFIIRSADGEEVPVQILPATEQDLAATRQAPVWQTDWASEYLPAPTIDKFAMKLDGGELVALGAYQISARRAYVYILYLESAPANNPTLVGCGRREYYGIGKAMIAFGIKYSIDNGCRGDVLFNAKTDELARHYERDFGAKRVASISPSGPKRYMLADEDAWKLFSEYLTEEEPE